MPNGDGIGYLKAAAQGGCYAGHVGYVPLLRAVARLLAGPGFLPASALLAGRLLSALGAAVAVGALGFLATRLHGSRRAGYLAGFGLASSAGLLVAGCDVETYAPALGALLLAVALLVVRRDGGSPLALAGAALALSVAILLHVENVLFLPAALLLLAPRDAWRFAAVVVLAVGAAYAAPLAERGPAFLLTATHGLRYPIGPDAPLLALYGAGKAFVLAPYPHEAGWGRVVAQSSLGIAALLLVVGTALRRRPAPLSGRVIAAWVVPYALVGLVYFASDAERWLFLLPLGWLAVAAVPRLQLLPPVLLALHLLLWLPQARDGAAVARARDAAAALRDGDLVLGPGHSWEELIPVFGRPAVEIYPLVYHAARLGGDREALARHLSRRMHAARARGGRVMLVRFSDEKDPLGWQDLELLGLSRAAIDGLLPGERSPRAADVEELLAPAVTASR